LSWNGQPQKLYRYSVRRNEAPSIVIEVMQSPALAMIALQIAPLKPKSGSDPEFLACKKRRLQEIPVMGTGVPAI